MYKYNTEQEQNCTFLSHEKIKIINIKEDNASYEELRVNINSTSRQAIYEILLLKYS